METSITRWLTQKLKNRLQTLLWGAVASEVETATLLDHVADLERIENAALQYEADGKPHLAELLRRRAATLTPDNPGGSALPALEHLAESDLEVNRSVPALPHQTPAEEDAPKRRRGRPRKNENSGAGD